MVAWSLASNEAICYFLLCLMNRSNLGTLLFLRQVIVFAFTDSTQISTREVPIVHRIIEIRDDGQGDIKILTKGDNNMSDDRGLYAPNQLWLKPSDIVGRATA